MKYFLVFAVFITVSNIEAQQVTNKSVSAAIVKIPDSLTKNASGISSYIKQQFVSDSDRLRAIFAWEANNISYDIDNMFALSYGEGRQEKIQAALVNRKAICEGYAELFAELSYQCGIKATVVQGYTKQKGMVDYIPHAWVAANLYNKWYLFDPTWSSGYIDNGKFVHQFTNRYYKTDPMQMIKSHMPFDPLYQFLNYPVTTKEFYEGNFSINTGKPFFNFEDSLVIHANLPETDKLKNSVRRIESNGVRSSMILQMLQYLKNKDINLQANIYNSASSRLNEAVLMFNHFIDFKNKQFQPKKQDKEIEQMLSVAIIHTDTASVLLSTIKADDPGFKKSVEQLQSLLSDLRSKLQAEKEFVNKYINTKKIFRPLLFRKIG